MIIRRFFLSIMTTGILIVPMAFSQSQISATTTRSKTKLNDSSPSRNSVAEKSKFHQKLSVTGWTVLAENKAGQTEMVLKSKSGKALLKFVPRDKQSRIIDAEEVKLDKYPNPLLITRWKKGAHDQVLRIFDPTNTKEPLLMEHQSGWRVEYEVIQESVLIKYFFRKLELSKKWTPEAS